MGLFLDKPKREKVVETGDGNGLHFAVSAMQGWRVDMEDSHSMKTDLAPKLKDCSYFAVFDGHAGDFVSKYAAEHLYELILNNLEGKSNSQATEERKKSSENLPANESGAGGDGEKIQDSENASSLSTNSSISVENKTEEAMSGVVTSASIQNSLPGNDEQGSGPEPMATEGEQKLNKAQNVEHLGNDLEHFKVCTRQGFLDLDEKLKELPRFMSGDERSGSTAIAVFVTTTHVIFANCGDSRALLSRSGGKLAFATTDHKPYNEEEKQRIEKAGGSVIIQRVNGSLAVSRALGDFDYKRVAGLPCTEQLVSAEPELTCIERHPEDEFLILACDGIWDVMTNQEVADFVRHRLSIHQNLSQLCGEILETSLAKGSKDNMSVIVVTFSGAPKVLESAIESDKKLDNLLKGKISEFVSKSSDPKEIDTSVVIDYLQEQEIVGLPPGGGLPAKMNEIEGFLDELIPDRTKEEGPQLGASIPLPLNMIRQFTAGGVVDEEGMQAADTSDKN